MRLTVGPLPSAVYWRRRAVVLGGLLLIVVVLYASCGGSDSGAKKNNTAAKPSPSATVSASAKPEPTQTVLPEQTGQPAGGGDGSADPGGTGPGGAEAPPPQAPAGNGPCADEELEIRPVPAKSQLSAGSPIDIRLLVKNAGDRSCARDVGADLQELRIVSGAETVWSSDVCGPARGSDVRTIAPGAELEYMVTWNGEKSAKCSRGVPDGGKPPAGQYQLLARLGTKHSTPVVLTLT